MVYTCEVDTLVFVSKGVMQLNGLSIESKPTLQPCVSVLVV